ncbi:Fe/S biogenesis protein NfuA [Moraxella caviae]|uniref:Fe/S biogenesis protein NfuA n=1 Tax=Moraxella caviae TaxID=34060 RepID=A0A1T0A4X6_9GAMM|nr:Fe-S biogenesis protein NfuA [Moraxella caviae]OOR90852.1 Fe/S biogenesis protein NfuA [Moraxella caviae]STZ10687.1 Fe/S biogenesis protein nfuA [Moraxella caviae]VEW10858.1 Fe/S biogenesis protein nfuA [Moraxella caviae]
MSEQNTQDTQDDVQGQEIPKESNIKITESAQEYLAELLAKQEVEGIGVRIFVEHPGTPRAECCMSYCQPDEVDEDDLQIPYAKFTAHIDAPSIPYLHDAVIDYNKDRFGGQLTFRAPNSKVPQVGANASIEERINYVLQSEINPQLASHGGMVELLEVIEDDAGKTAVLKFGGGCQGCAAVDVTLRQGVEVQLKQQIPELTHVVDETDHSVSTNAYYK